MEDAVKKDACNAFAWDGLPPGKDNGLIVTCKDNEMTIAVHAEIIYDTPIKFIIDTENPAKTPEVFYNYWTVTHYNKNPDDPNLSADELSASIMSSAVQPSWQV